LLQSAFRNLIKNSCQYSDDQCTNIDLNFSEREVTVTINNHGPTLAQKETDQLFTPFFRGENATSKKGFGLGLSICQRIIEIHHGKITYSVPQPYINRMTVVLPREL
jgi:signal transduction histidine kinase